MRAFCANWALLSGKANHQNLRWVGEPPIGRFSPNNLRVVRFPNCVQRTSLVASGRRLRSHNDSLRNTRYGTRGGQHAGNGRRAECRTSRWLRQLKCCRDVRRHTSDCGRPWATAGPPGAAEIASGRASDRYRPACAGHARASPSSMPRRYFAVSRLYNWRFRQLNPTKCRRVALALPGTIRGKFVGDEAPCWFDR